MMLRLFKLGYFLAWRCGLYMWWSKLYRFLWQRKYRKIPVDHGLTPAAVLDNLRLLKWTEDGPRELWDAVASPHWVQYCINMRQANQPQPKGGLDCDEFAEWAALSLSAKYKPQVLNVFWKGRDEWCGHHVCVYTKVPGELYHIGNWGVSGPYTSLSGVIRDMLRVVRAEELVGWCVWEPRTMRLRLWGTKL